MRTRHSLPALFTALVLAIAMGNASASTPGTKLWDATYDGPDSLSDHADAVAVSPDGSTAYMAGSLASATTGFDYVTVAYDSTTGAVRWSTSYDGAANGDDEPTSIGVSPNGAVVYVTGQSAGANGPVDVATVAYDAATGTQKWAKRYNGAADGYDGGTDLVVGSTGTVFVTGVTTDSQTGVDYLTLAYARNGDRLWAKRFNGGSDNDDTAASIAINPDASRVFVTGVAFNTPTGGDIETVAYDATTGAKAWSKAFGSPTATVSYDEARAVTLNPTGTRVFVTGTVGLGTVVDGVFSSDVATIAYKAGSGAKVWAELYDAPAAADDQGVALVVSPDGTELFVVGASPGAVDSSYDSFDYATVAYGASDGHRLWVKRLDGADHLADIASAMAVDPSGTAVYVTGYSRTTGGSFDVSTIAYGLADGAKVFARSFASGNGVAIAVDPAGGRLLVVGSKEASQGQDCLTIAYAT